MKKILICIIICISLFSNFCFATKDIEKPLKAAIMGCVVNGPGEAKEADIGIAGGGTGEKAVVFKKGEKLATGELEAMIQLLINEIHNL